MTTVAGNSFTPGMQNSCSSDEADTVIQFLNMLSNLIIDMFFAISRSEDFRNGNFICQYLKLLTLLQREQ